MVQPVLPSSIPVNASLPLLVVPRPVEQLRNTGVRPNTPEGVTASDEDSAVEGQNQRGDQQRIAGQRQAARGGSGFEGLGGTLDLLV